MKLYLAGSLFNEAEVAQRIKEGKILKQKLPEIEVFNPIDQPFNEDKQSLPTPEEIYENDSKVIIESDIFLADLTNEDPGVMLELGLAIMSNTKIIVGINSDIRMKSSNRYEIPPYGMNHFVLGALKKYGYIVYSFEEAIILIRNLL